MRRGVALVLTVSVVVVSTVGCSALGSAMATPTPRFVASNPATVELTPTPRDPVPGPPVHCTSYVTLEQGRPLDLLPGRYLRVTLCDNGSITAYSGCNYISGSYAIQKDRLVVQQMDRTLIGCPKADDDEDQLIESFFEAGQIVDVQADWLTIAGMKFFREPVPPATPAG